MRTFQSTPPRGKRPPVGLPHRHDPTFQSTPPRGKRRARTGGSHEQDVSIHAPAREATFSPCMTPWGTPFQSTPPRGKRHVGVGQAAPLAHVSIHAPAREATSSVPTTIPPGGSFNPRPRAGSDSAAAGPCVLRGALVSIHAPAREATWPPRRTARRTGFNPRPRAGSDMRATFSWTFLCSFNPRPRAGSDSRITWVGRTRSSRVSIHAPAREATCTARKSVGGSTRFNPRPRAGSDARRPSARCRRPRRFNPRPRAGSDAPLGHRLQGVLVSIHAPAREATRRA